MSGGELPTARERFDRYGEACKGLDELVEELNFEQYHTAGYEETPNIDEYVKGKKRVCLFYNKEELQAAVTAEQEPAQNDT